MFINTLDMFLHILASHYMTSFQGDILIDHQTIVDRLEQNGEIECYLAKSHFDTEKRFEYDGHTSVLAAREEAKKKHWGDYTILLKKDKDSLIVSIKKSTEDAPNFPIDRIDDMVGGNALKLVNCSFNNQYGKHETR